ncbi:MAG: DUF4145 domain-containing protein [Pseudomonadota bacterium]
MATLVTDCPRCGAKEHTFDVPSHVVRNDTGHVGWLRRAETFAVCRRCKRPTIFLLELNNYDARDLFDRREFWENEQTSLNDIFRVLRHIGPMEFQTRKPPPYLPEEIEQRFSEGATCLAAGCYNAAGTMFRLCLDLATRDLLPPQPEDGEDVPPDAPNRRQRRDLGLRIPWLLENDLLPKDLAELSDVVREDGNDGAHRGGLELADAEDLADFAEVLLDRLYTEPERIELAKARRVERRQERR